MWPEKFVNQRLVLAIVLGSGLLFSCLGGSSEDTYSRGAAGCPPGTKRCGDACVSKVSPLTGCGSESCSLCPSSPHAEAICVNEMCSPGACEAGFGDCDGKTANGCETDLLSDRKHCGGCGASCEVSGTDSTCDLGVCKVVHCEAPRGDCNADGRDGCEVDFSKDPLHCGTCETACSSGEVCSGGICVQNDETKLWLASQRGGFCNSTYNQFINLCGEVGSCTKFKVCTDDMGGPKGECWEDAGHAYPASESWPGGVPFCCNPQIMKVYPEGLSFDIGFHYNGQATGDLINLGGDCDEKFFTLSFSAPGKLVLDGWKASGVPQIDVTQGTHLVSLRLTSEQRRIFLDGILVLDVPGYGVPIELLGECGPGFILGQRLSYWYEQNKAGFWLKMAPFFVHLRDGSQGEAWSLSEAVLPSERTIVLFEPSGASTKSNRWTGTKGGITAVAVDAFSPSTPPLWVENAAAQCP